MKPGDVDSLLLEIKDASKKINLRKLNEIIVHNFSIQNSVIKKNPKIALMANILEWITFCETEKLYEDLILFAFECNHIPINIKIMLLEKGFGGLLKSEKYSQISKIRKYLATNLLLDENTFDLVFKQLYQSLIIYKSKGKSRRIISSLLKHNEKHD